MLPETMNDEQEELLNRLKYAMWGLNGGNGVVSEVRGLRRELREYIQAEDKRRGVEARQAKIDLENSKRERTRNRLTAFGIIVTGVFGLVTAILTIAQAVG